jgi:hypothetical protein
MAKVMTGEEDKGKEALSPILVRLGTNYIWYINSY